MDYKQILSQEECKGKVIDRIVRVHNNTFFVFADNTYCVYNVNFCDRDFDIEYTVGAQGLLKLGFITKQEHEKREAKYKARCKELDRRHEIKSLKTLAAKYPDVLKG